MHYVVVCRSTLVPMQENLQNKTIKCRFYTHDNPVAFFENAIKHSQIHAQTQDTSRESNSGLGAGCRSAKRLCHKQSACGSGRRLCTTYKPRGKYFEGAKHWVSLELKTAKVLFHSPQLLHHTLFQSKLIKPIN